MKKKIIIIAMCSAFIVGGIGVLTNINSKGIDNKIKNINSVQSMANSNSNADKSITAECPTEMPTFEVIIAEEVSPEIDEAIEPATELIETVVESTEPMTEPEPYEYEEEHTDNYSSNYSDYELDLLARTIYQEAGICGEYCQWLVGSTVLNLADERDGIESVVFDYNTFNVAYKLYDEIPSDLSYSIAERVLSGDRDYVVKAFRTDYYHSFGTPYTNVDNVYFSTY